MNTEPRDMLILCLKQPAIGGYALWWRPNRAGYCAEVEGAGRYSKTEAKEICAPAYAEAVPVPLHVAAGLAHMVADQGAVLRHPAVNGVLHNSLKVPSCTDATTEECRDCNACQDNDDTPANKEHHQVEGEPNG